MYQAFKNKLLEEMELRRDMLVLRASETSLEPIFEVSTPDDKLYKRILDEFDRLAVQHVENLLYDLCVKHEIRAVKAGNKGRFDLEIDINGIRSCIELKTSPAAFNSSSMGRFRECVESSELPVYLVYLLKDNQQSRSALARHAIRMQDSKEPDKLKVFLFEDFVLELFGREELIQFKKAMITYKDEMHRAIGYQITEIFNMHNLTVLKEELDNEFRNFEYDRIKAVRFAELHTEDPNFRDLNDFNFNNIKNEFIGQNRYKLLLGSSDFAMSFLTSEWLFKKYFSLEEMDNTFIVAGYLKSIEQMLWSIIYIIGQGRQIREATIEEDNFEDIDTTLGSLQHFITNYVNEDLFESIFGSSTRFVMRYLRAQLSAWRAKYRNGYFHKHNLTERQKIDAIRDETFFLYLLILGAISLSTEDMNTLGM